MNTDDLFGYRYFYLQKSDKIQSFIKEMAFKPYSHNLSQIFYYHSDISGYQFYYHPCLWNQYSHPYIQLQTTRVGTDKDEDTLTRSSFNETHIKLQFFDDKSLHQKPTSSPPTNNHQFQSPKTIQSKTKDLMRPFARILYYYFKKLLHNSQILSEPQKQQINIFIDRVDQLRSTQPCKFTELIMNLLRNGSVNLKEYVNEYVSGCQFQDLIMKSGCYKYWENKEELVSFLREFILENHDLLKPTKYYKLVFRKVF